MDIVTSKEFTDILLDPNKAVVERSHYYRDSNIHLTELVVEGKVVASRVITSTAATFYAVTFFTDSYGRGAYYG